MLIWASEGKQTSRREEKNVFNIITGERFSLKSHSEGKLDLGLLSYINMHMIYLKQFVCLSQSRAER